MHKCNFCLPLMHSASGVFFNSVTPEEVEMGNEEFPVQYYEVIEGNTITKKNGWWEAVVRYRKPYSNSEDQEVALYKWKRDTDKEKWIRKQKYAFRNRKDWLAVGDCVENMFSRM